MSLKAAVGAGSGQVNRHSTDVQAVIQLLNNHIRKNFALAHLQPLATNLPGDSPLVIAAITEFQTKVMEMRKPDGRVDRGGKTIKALQKTPKDSLAAIQATVTILEALVQGPVGGISNELWSAGLLSMLSHLDEMQLVKYNLITLVDYTLPSSQQRLWVVDLPGRTAIMNVKVAHGSGRKDKEGGNAHSNPRFSNDTGSNESTVGGFVTLYEKMTSLGSIEKLPGRSERGRTLVVEGLDSTNNRMRSRGIYFHGASYVTPTRSRIGMSHGCFATYPDHNNAILDLIKDGSFGYAYAGPDHMPPAN